MPKLSVIMPAFNEATRITNSIVETTRFLKQANYEYELIVVDDGSFDNTYHEILKNQTDSSCVRGIHLRENSGKGFALRYGSVFATGDLIVFLDADLDLHPYQIRILHKEMQDTGADLVIGSKRHPESKLDYPLHRRILSDGYYILMRLLFGLPVKDTQTGIKIIKQEALEKIFPRLLTKRFAFDLELLIIAHRMGFRIVEAPITLGFQREFGRIKWNDVRNVVLDTWAIFYRSYLLRSYDGQNQSYE